VVPGYRNKVLDVTRISAAFSIVFILAMLVSASVFGQSAAHKPKSFPLWNFDEVDYTCRAKGRLQDKEYCESKLMDQIIAARTAAIPMLICQLTDARETKKPIYDCWGQTTAGDIAYFILHDLFTDSNWTTFNMPGLEALKDNCNAAETCWRRFLKEHGRKFVQDQWLAAWHANNGRVYWDEQGRCFRLSPENHRLEPFSSVSGCTRSAKAWSAAIMRA
jgi:hypothetical protein